MKIKSNLNDYYETKFKRRVKKKTVQVKRRCTCVLKLKKDEKVYDKKTNIVVVVVVVF